MEFPPFNQWLQKNADWLREEWRESMGDPVDRMWGTEDFTAWAKLEYENEKLRHQYCAKIS